MGADSVKNILDHQYSVMVGLLVVQWLGLHTPNERAHVQTLVRELRLHKPQLSLAQANK